MLVLVVVVVLVLVLVLLWVLVCVLELVRVWGVVLDTRYSAVGPSSGACTTPYL